MKKSIKWLTTVSAVVLATTPLTINAMGYQAAPVAIEWVQRHVETVRASIATQGGEYYVVEWGDTLGTIAEALSLPLSTLKQLNHIEDENFILVGTVIYYNNQQQTVSVVAETGEVETVSLIDGEIVTEEIPMEVLEVAQGESLEEVGTNLSSLPVIEATTVTEDVTAEFARNDHQEEAVAPSVELTEAPTLVEEMTPLEAATTEPVEEKEKLNFVGSYQPIQSAAKEWIAQKESGGDYNAINPTGKYIGRYQLTAEYLKGDYSIENQERVADEYVLKRYGSWEAAKVFWEANGWY